MPQAAAPAPVRATLGGEIIGSSTLTIWSLPSAERLRRLLQRAGATAGDGAARCLLLRADWVYDEVLVKSLARRDADCVLVGGDGQCVAASVGMARVPAVRELLAHGEAPADIPRLDAAQLAGNYNDALRKREPPFLLPLTAASQRDIEARVFKGSYKGVTDFVTLYFWPRPAAVFTGWCARLGISPNMVTSLSLVCVLAAMWCFWHGHYGWGLASAWFMTFLDTVDGKLARVTLTSSKIGNAFDHGIDLIHPPFWWWAWYVGCFGAVAITSDLAGYGLAVILVGYVVQRIFEGIFMRRYGFHVHSWRPFDSFFRLITARRNPNLLILTPAWLAGVLVPSWGVGAAQVGFHLVALWTALSLVVHAVQLVQALATPRERVVSWLSR